MLFAVMAYSSTVAGERRVPIQLLKKLKLTVTQIHGCACTGAPILASATLRISVQSNFLY